MARKISLWFVRVFVWLFFRLRFYYKVSKVYQRMQLTWANNGPDLPIIDQLSELEEILGKMVWRKDTIFQWFDTFEHPKAIWVKFVTDPKKGVEDCDGFAIFAADRMQDMMRRDVRLPDGGEILGVYIMTVNWRSDDKGFGGHNVCLVNYREVDSDESKWGNIGNWFNGKFWSEFGHPWNVARSIAGGRDLVHCAVATTNLDLLVNGWTEKAINRLE